MTAQWIECGFQDAAWMETNANDQQWQDFLAGADTELAESGGISESCKGLPTTMGVGAVAADMGLNSTVAVQYVIASYLDQTVEIPLDVMPAETTDLISTGAWLEVGVRKVDLFQAQWTVHVPLFV